MNRRGGVRLAGVPWAGSVRFACALLGLGVAGCGTDAMPPVVHVFPIREHTLPSGLRVVVEQDDTSMLAGVSWVVDVGQVDSPLGRPELAHAVEHLVLGSPDDEGVSHWERLNALGAVEVNGATSAELTTFQAFAPAQALDQLVAIELARMADPLRGASDELWARERKVVGEELDLRRDGTAATGTQLMMAALFPPTHVLGRDLARTREALKDVTLENLRQFAASYYRPERMTLVISGAIGPDWDERMWPTMPRTLYGQANDRHTPVRRPLAATAPMVNPVVALGRHAVGVATPELWTGWILPPARGVAALPLQALGDVVGAVLSDAIDQGRIPGVVRAEVAVSAGALASTLICRLLLRPDARVDDSVELVKQFVGSLANLRDGYPPRFSARALRLGVLRAAMATESLEARTVARARLVHDDPDASIGGLVMARRTVNAADVEQLATRYLTAGAARSLVLLPTDASARPFRAEGDARLEKGPAGELAARTEPEAEDDDADVASDGVKRSVLSVAKAPGAGAASVTQLKNGLTLIVLRRPGLPFASMLLGFHAEPTRGGGARGARRGGVHPVAGHAPVRRGSGRASEYHARSRQLPGEPRHVLR
jgi:predicted Zn-dependent peptidase